MVKIKLKDFYPFEKDDAIIEVSDELAATLYAFERQEASYIRKLRRHQAYYSLDRTDGVEHSIILHVKSPDEIYERKVSREELHAALAQLPDKQAKRIYAHYLLGMGKDEIAQAEGVSWFSINKSIRQGLIRIEKILQSSSKQYQ